MKRDFVQQPYQLKDTIREKNKYVKLFKKDGVVLGIYK